MKTLLVSLILASNAFALTKNEILEISKAPHSRENLIKELEVFTEARELKVSLNFHFPEGIPAPPKTVVKEKTVEGKYIVSEFTVGPPNQIMNLIMVATYKPEIQSYKKWLFNTTNQDLQEFTGVRLPDSSFFSWVRVDEGIAEGSSHRGGPQNSGQRLSYKNGGLEP